MYLLLSSKRKLFNKESSLQGSSTLRGYTTIRFSRSAASSAIGGGTPSPHAERRKHVGTVQGNMTPSGAHMQMTRRWLDAATAGRGATEPGRYLNAQTTGDAKPSLRRKEGYSKVSHSVGEQSEDTWQNLPLPMHNTRLYQDV